MPHVVVIGAGYAGLTAARALAGHADVTVLDARDRVGGRAWTLADPSGAIVDLGAQWVGPPHERVCRLADELEVARTDAPTGDSAIRLDGKTLRLGAALLLRSPRLALSLSRAVGGLEKAVRGVPAENAWTAPDASALDARSLANVLDDLSRDGRARRILDELAAVGLSGDTADISALAALAAIAGSGGLAGLLGGDAESEMFDRGADAIPRAIARELGDRVRLDCPVGEVADRGARVRVAGPWGALEADRVVLAMPPTFAARLLGERDGPRAGLYRGAILKAVAVYERPFWADAGRSAMTYAPGAPVPMTADVSRGGFGVLATLVPGHRAQALATTDAGERRGLVLDAFADAVGAAARHPIAFHDHAWASDRWTLGGYGELAPPGLLTQERASIATSRGRVHFAGTETSPAWNGHFEGAVRSGERVAEEVRAALGL